ncbi:RHS repeat-associated core domain-containing protein [Pseudomonas sp. NFACC15-1]|uniref:RHS repeat domain-containing protein n=1 Tax=unclassified Pseudomonas TaxID=196821 RepID=UPI0008887A23|nr:MULTISPECIES: RHS repeat-associated core domain-containing protein [unclassified Pseudomonas]SDA87144.1 RHS repeat-associated core domain-containing protein [Pseudomonas sp. NFACC15-1]SDY78180.1 RHS repeat-associated core domain-containing protein [Pseudomonas sp. NFACC14]
MTTATSVPSNAFNFLNFILSQVDPRTGQYTCAISLPELKANNLCGPVVPLQLNFNALNTSDSGFGKGWDLQLSQYNPHSRILSLYSGETFKVDPGPDGMEIPEKKLDTFHFHDLGDQRYKVVHKSGLVEILQVGQGQVAMPVEMLSPQGHSVTLEYTAFGTQPLLNKIRNADRTELLRLERSANILEVKLYPDTALEALFVLNILGGETKSVVLPTDDLASWRFDYISLSGLTLLKEVRTPAGGHETVSYSGTPHSFPGVLDRTLPRVHWHKIDPGFGQPIIETHYEYDRTGNNFLGYGSGVTWTNNGLDNLYRDGVVRGYRYETSEILWDAQAQKPIRTTRRVFNRFHLQVLEETSQKASAPGKDDSLLVTETEYYGDPLDDFKDQPAYFQLPKRLTQTWRNVAATLPRHSEVTTSTYDDFGNLLVQVNANGVTETNTWYSALGEDDCPADPHGFVRNIKSKTVTPAASEYGEAPVLQTCYRYVEYPGLAGSDRWLALSDETLFQVVDDQPQTELRRIAHEYLVNPDDPRQHGLLSKMRQTLYGQDDTLTTTEYAYSMTRSARTGAMVMRTETTLVGYDDQPRAPIRKTIIEEHSLLNGARLLSTDDVGTEIVYQYDRLGRVIEESVAPDTAYHAKRTYSYTLTNTPEQQAQQWAKDAKGVETITWLDGLNRVLKVQRQDADAMGGEPDALRETYRATYNALGQLASETDIDWEGSKNVALTSRYEYDAWGEQYKVIGSDGVAHVTENDPPSQTLRSWSESVATPVKITGKTRSTLNRFGKEDKVEALDAADKTVSEMQFFYDGLGNCVEQIDPMGEATRFTYDLFGRVQATTLPDYSEIHRTYARHSADELPIKLEVVANETSTCVGSQTFDGLDRQTTLKVGPRLQQFQYKGGQLQVDTRITASNQSISYEYQLGLTGAPVASIAPDEQSSFNYDQQSAQLTLSENTQGQHSFDYSSTGQLRRESWTEKRSGKQWQSHYTHTLNGRPLTRTNDNGLLCTYDYDEKARLKSVTQGQIQATFEYDSLGQISLITTQNTHTRQSLETRLSFDDQGREILRQINLSSGHPQQTITQVYRADSKLHSRHRQQGDETELLETFGYDPRGRLVQYNCEGSQLPQDRYGNGICEQLFAFDALDNITEVYTLFADGSRDETVRTFADDDHCQLVRITHKHPDYPDSIELDYDEDGNLLHDENGQRLTYDSQGRLLRVTDSDGKTVSQYRYDAHDHLFGVTHESDEETLRFYDDDSLTRTEQGDRKIHYLGIDGQPLGQQQQDDPERTLLLLTDAKNSVLGESSQDELRKAVYGAYGERRPQDDLQCLLGFNGEVRDETSGWYLLGRGYRAYNPTLMCFHSPDSLSPFDAGGINPYMYTAGDPINFVDPTGHANRGVNWLGALGAALSAIGIALSIAAVVIAPPVGALAIGVTSTFTLLGIGAGVYGMYEGIMATHATRLRDRERKQTSALISGGLDTLFGVWGLSQAMKAAAKVASAAAATQSWHAQVAKSFGSIGPDQTAIISRSGTGAAASAVDEGASAAVQGANAAKRSASATEATDFLNEAFRSKYRFFQRKKLPRVRSQYTGPTNSRKLKRSRSVGDSPTEGDRAGAEVSSNATELSGAGGELIHGRDGKWHLVQSEVTNGKLNVKSFSAKVSKDGKWIRDRS